MSIRLLDHAGSVKLSLEDGPFLWGGIPQTVPETVSPGWAFGWRDERGASVALAAGLAYQSHFTRAFKRYTGLTPNAYRGSPRR